MTRKPGFFDPWRQAPPEDEKREVLDPEEAAERELLPWPCVGFPGEHYGFNVNVPPTADDLGVAATQVILSAIEELRVSPVTRAILVAGANASADEAALCCGDLRFPGPLHDTLGRLFRQMERTSVGAAVLAKHRIKPYLKT